MQVNRLQVLNESDELSVDNQNLDNNDQNDDVNESVTNQSQHNIELITEE